MSLELCPQAVCILLFRQVPEGPEVLAIARKDNPNDFGLPGGKVDPEEKPIWAAQREFKEETNIKLPWKDIRDHDHFVPVYSGMCWSPGPSLDEILSTTTEKCRNPDTNGYLTTTFMLAGVESLQLPASLFYNKPDNKMKKASLDLLEGYQPDGEGILGWKTPGYLAHNGSFKAYNMRLFRHMGLIY